MWGASEGNNCYCDDCNNVRKTIAKSRGLKYTPPANKPPEVIKSTVISNQHKIINDMEETFNYG